MHNDQYAPVKGLTLEQKGMLFDAIFIFNLGEEPNITDPVVAMAFSFFRQSFERNASKYEEKCRKNRENIQRRYAKTTNVYGGSNSYTNGTDNDPDPDPDPDSDPDSLREDKEDTNVSLSPAFGLDDSEGQPENSGKAEKPKAAPSIPDCPHQQIIAIYHECLPELPKVRVWGDTRKKHLASRWKETMQRLKARGEPCTVECGLDWWRKFFIHRVRPSPLLMGKRGKWNASLDWLVKAESYAKTLEGQYFEKETA